MTTAAELLRLSVAEVSALARGLTEADTALWALLEQDPRLGVRRLAVRRGRQVARERRESARAARMLEFEERFWGRGLVHLAGVDEVGRGCLAGPVVAAAVILPPGTRIEGLDDSKKLTPATRERLAGVIAARATAVGLGQADAAVIDEVNILRASLLAMRTALESLSPPPEQVLVDGAYLPGSPFPELAIVDGDARSQVIAAASVVAKVHRDRLMVEWDRAYPGYGFAAHKGYGSPQHLSALAASGPCPLHRRSFAPVQRAVGGSVALARELGDLISASRDREELERIGQRVRTASSGLAEAELTELRRLYRQRLATLTDTGPEGERLAAEHLAGKGYRLLARRYRGGGGEIDLVAEQGGELVFVEVKASRSGVPLGAPEERVQGEKRARLVRAARHYLARHGPGREGCRFDVIAVRLGDDGPRLDHLEDAFRP